MEKGAFEKQIQFQASDDSKVQRLLKRRHRRVTFLVNIWLNYKPFNVNSFPKTMLDKLSGFESKDRKGLEFQSGTKSVPTRCVSVSTTFVKDSSDSGIILDNSPTKCTWPMGDCDSKETIKVYMPIEIIRNEASDGGNVKMLWGTTSKSESNCEASFGLYQGESLAESAKREKEKENNEGSTKRAKTKK
jgi:hypothetical protein